LAERIEVSLAHDIAFIVAAEVRKIRPEASWEVIRERFASGVYRWIAFPDRDGEELVGYGRVLLSRILAAEGQVERLTHGAQGPEVVLTRLRAQVKRLSSKAMAAAPAEPEGPAKVWSSRFEVRRPPKPGAPAAPRPLVEALEAFRNAGFFASRAGESAEKLAKSFQEMWRAVEEEELPLDPLVLLDDALLELDYERTYAEMVDAGVLPGEKAYETTVRGLAKVSDGALEVISVDEDWTSEEDYMTVTVDLPGGTHRIRLRQMIDWMDPYIVTELNALLPEDGPRFWFFDNGGQYGLVVRATRAERQALAEARGTRLDEEPPTWWNIRFHEDE